MTTTTHTDDLAAICERLSEQLEKIDRAINEKTAKISELADELASIRRNQANYAGDLEHTKTVVSQAQSLVTQATTDARLAKKTSLEQQKADELTAAREQLKRAEAQLATLQTSLEHDSKAEADTGAAIASLQGEIASLQTERQEVAATHQRFSREQANHIRTLGLEMLNEIDAEIASLQAKLDQANAYRAEALRKFARDMALWPEMCVSTLAEVANFADSPDAAAIDLKLKYVDLLSARWDDISLNAKRLLNKELPIDAFLAYGGMGGYLESQRRAQERHGSASGRYGIVVADARLQGFVSEVEQLRGLLVELRSKQQEIAAMALLSEVQKTSSS